MRKTVKICVYVSKNNNYIITDSVQSVSYTHLDVYKRQANNS